MRYHDAIKRLEYTNKVLTYLEYVAGGEDGMIALTFDINEEFLGQWLASVIMNFHDKKLSYRATAISILGILMTERPHESAQTKQIKH